MEFEKSRIERLKQSLYSRNEALVPKEKRTPVRAIEEDAKTDWGTPSTFDFSAETMSKKNNSFFNKFLGISITFFCIALAIALFIFFGGLNMISSNNVDVKITGPSSISSGEELSAALSVINGNHTDLDHVTLSITYPDGTKAIGTNSPLTRDKVDLGTISKGSEKEYAIRALMFGEKGAIKTITLSVEYSIKGSNAVFSKEKTYEVSIGSSPLLLNISSPQDINSGQEVSFDVDVTSNSPVVVSNALVKVEYPYGFTYKTSNIKPIHDNNIWNIGDLKNGDKKTLHITGTLVGQNNEERSFRFSVGTPSAPTATTFDTDLASSQVTIGIHKSFFNLSLFVGEGGNGVGQITDTAPVRIAWSNTLPDKIVNAQIALSLSGNALDQSGVSVANNGYFRSGDNVILWDKNAVENLAVLSPGDSGELSVTTKPLRSSGQHIIKNPHIDFKTTMSGERVGSGGAIVNSESTATLKFSSEISLSASSLRNGGELSNTGPIPPRVDKSSTYTVRWVLTNTSNDLKNATVKATLPSNVSWAGEVSPQSEKINYNPDTRQVVWNIDEVSSGAGFIHAPPTVYFKVTLVPSITQINSLGNLTGPSVLSAVDTYTGATLSGGAEQVTTRFSDASYQQGNEIIVK